MAQGREELVFHVAHALGLGARSTLGFEMQSSRGLGALALGDVGDHRDQLEGFTVRCRGQYSGELEPPPSSVVLPLDARHQLEGSLRSRGGLQREVELLNVVGVDDPGLERLPPVERASARVATEDLVGARVLPERHVRDRVPFDDAQLGGAGRQGETLLALPLALFGKVALGDVDRDAIDGDRLAVRVRDDPTTIGDPADGAVWADDAIDGIEERAGVVGSGQRRLEQGRVIGVDAVDESPGAAMTELVFTQAVELGDVPVAVETAGAQVERPGADLGGREDVLETCSGREQGRLGALDLRPLALGELRRGVVDEGAENRADPPVLVTDG